MPTEGKSIDTTIAADALLQTEISASKSHSWLLSTLSWFGRHFFEGLAAYGASICLEFAHPIYDEIHSCEVPPAKRKANGAQNPYEVVHLKLRSVDGGEADLLTVDEMMRLEKFIAELRQGG